MFDLLKEPQTEKESMKRKYRMERLRTIAAIVSMTVQTLLMIITVFHLIL